MKRNNNSVVKSFLHGSVISFVGVIIIGIFNYLIRRSLAVNLTQIEYGFFYSAYTLLCIFFCFLDLGLGQTTTVLISKYLTKKNLPKVKEIYSIIFYIKLISSIIFMIVLYLLSSYLIKDYFNYSKGKVIFNILCCLVPIVCIETLIYTVLDGYQKFTLRNLFIIVRTLLNYFIVIIFIPDYGLYAVVFGTIIASSITCIIGLIFLGFKMKLFPLSTMPKLFSTIKELANFAKWIAIAIAGLSIMNYMDTFMLTYLTDLNSVAEYNIALPITQILQTLLILPVVFTPIASKMWQEKNYAQLKSITYNAMLCLIWIGFPVLIGLIFLSKDIISIMFPGKEYAINAKYALMILGSGVPLFAIAQFYINTLTAMEKPTKVAKIVIIGVVCNIIFNSLLIPHFNIEGAAIATIGAYFIIAVSAIIILNKELNFKTPKTAIIFIIIIGIIISTMAYHIGMRNTLVQNIIYALSAIFIYGLLTIYFFISIIKEVLQIIRREK